MGQVGLEPALTEPQGRPHVLFLVHLPLTPIPYTQQFCFSFLYKAKEDNLADERSGYLATSEGEVLDFGVHRI